MVLEVGGGLFGQSDVRETATETLRIGAVPIGAIMAWVKTLGGVPALPTEFVECNGQVLNDSESLLNGQTIPNLNGNQNFLRGAAASGGTGGSADHNHQFLYADSANTAKTWVSDGSSLINYLTRRADVTVTGAGAAVYAGTGNWEHSYTKDEATLPPYYEIVWIMRIK